MPERDAFEKGPFLHNWTASAAALGRATLTPKPRRTVRRERDFLVMIILEGAAGTEIFRNRQTEDPAGDLGRLFACTDRLEGMLGGLD